MEQTGLEGAQPAGAHSRTDSSLQEGHCQGQRLEFWNTPSRDGLQSSSSKAPRGFPAPHLQSGARESGRISGLGWQNTGDSPQRESLGLTTQHTSYCFFWSAWYSFWISLYLVYAGKWSKPDLTTSELRVDVAWLPTRAAADFTNSPSRVLAMPQPLHTRPTSPLPAPSEATTGNSSLCVSFKWESVQIICSCTREDLFKQHPILHYRLQITQLPRFSDG